MMNQLAAAGPSSSILPDKIHCGVRVRLKMSITVSYWFFNYKLGKLKYKLLLLVLNSNMIPSHYKFHPDDALVRLCQAVSLIFEWKSSARASRLLHKRFYANATLEARMEAGIEAPLEAPYVDLQRFSTGFHTGFPHSVCVEAKTRNKEETSKYIIP